ncbi:hypothetical protein ABNG02_00865 [Halorubrum ejinorense]|uniref:Uncharacterized protein n=1 Tax=Halorubrum ejinorense TaxID=425309 RepID=A0AAV3SNS9_9EURY
MEITDPTGEQEQAMIEYEPTNDELSKIIEAEPKTRDHKVRAQFWFDDDGNIEMKIAHREQYVHWLDYPEYLICEINAGGKVREEKHVMERLREIKRRIEYPA